MSRPFRSPFRCWRGPARSPRPVLLAGQAAGRPIFVGMLIAVIAAVCALTAAVFYFATRIARFLGVTGHIVLSRLLGVLAALAVQYVIDGVKAALA